MTRPTMSVKSRIKELKEYRSEPQSSSTYNHEINKPWRDTEIIFSFDE